MRAESECLADCRSYEPLKKVSASSVDMIKYSKSFSNLQSYVSQNFSNIIQPFVSDSFPINFKVLQCMVLHRLLLLCGAVNSTPNLKSFYVVSVSAFYILHVMF